MAWTDATRSRARTAPRDPHRPGPHGRQKCGPSRTLQLTDAGRETVREDRAALAAETPGNWRTIHRMFGPPWYVRREYAVVGMETGTGTDTVVTS